jgi:hypothetical protein
MDDVPEQTGHSGSAWYRRYKDKSDSYLKYSESLRDKVTVTISV